MNTELIILDTVKIDQKTIATKFTHKGGASEIIAAAQDAARTAAEGLGVGTAKERQRLASIAHSISKAKVALDDHGKLLVEDAKKQIKIVDDERKSVRDSFDALRDEIRLPVTKWEQDKAEREQETERLLQFLKQSRMPVDEAGGPVSSDVIKARIENVQAVSVPDDYGELKGQIDTSKAEALDSLNAMLSVSVENEAKALELERLRKEAAERETKEAQIKRDAEVAARAKEEAEAAAKAQIDAAKAETEKAKADAIAKAEAADREAKALAEKAVEDERRKVAAEKAAVEAAAKAKADAEAKKAADTEHQGRINKKALDSLIALGFDEAVSKKLIGAVAKGLVPNITINY